MSSKPFKPRQAAARLGVAVEALPQGGAWSGEEVRSLRAGRPDWLTQARRAYAATQDQRAAQRPLDRERRRAAAPKARCLCCEAEYRFEIESGGLCDDCNEGECPNCGADDDWEAW